MLLVQDQVDYLSRVARPEVPAAHGAVWVVLVQRVPVPWHQFERVEHIGVGVKGLIGKGCDLVGSSG